MAKDKSFLERSTIIDRSRMMSSVLVVVSSTVRLRPITPDVVMVNIVAHGVFDSPGSSDDVVLPAETGANLMANCTGCKKERERVGKGPRKLATLPKAIVESNEFKNQKLPINLCEYCDGSALESAMHAHDERGRPTTND